MLNIITSFCFLTVGGFFDTLKRHTRLGVPFVIIVEANCVYYVTTLYTVFAHLSKQLCGVVVEDIVHLGLV